MKCFFDIQRSSRYYFFFFIIKCADIAQFAMDIVGYIANLLCMKRVLLVKMVLLNAIAFIVHRLRNMTPKRLYSVEP